MTCESVAYYIHFKQHYSYRIFKFTNLKGDKLHAYTGENTPIFAVVNRTHVDRVT